MKRHTSFALRNCLLSVVLLFPSTGFSQYSESLVDVEGFSVKTDALALLNTVINDRKSYYLSGEIYFNSEYSFKADVGIETENTTDSKYNQKRFTGEWRWYFQQDDCSCSAFFGGMYFGTIHTRQSSDKSKNYSMSSLDAGVSGGYQVIFLEHFVLDPAVQIGCEFAKKMHQTETSKPPSGFNESFLQLRIQLGMGYRF